MKKLILLLFIPLVFSCSDDEDTPNMCVDETLINLETPCPFVIDPVCGCDGINYVSRWGNLRGNQRSIDGVKYGTGIRSDYL